MAVTTRDVCRVFILAEWQKDDVQSQCCGGGQEEKVVVLLFSA